MTGLLVGEVSGPAETRNPRSARDQNEMAVASDLAQVVQSWIANLSLVNELEEKSRGEIPL